MKDRCSKANRPIASFEAVLDPYQAEEPNGDQKGSLDGEKLKSRVLIKILA